VIKKWYLDYGYAQVGYVGKKYFVNIKLLTPICVICLNAIDSYITNLPGLIGLYKFRAKFDFHRFVQTSHELCGMANMNYIFTYSISEIVKQMRHCLLIIHEYSCLLHKIFIVLSKITSQQLHRFS